MQGISAGSGMRRSASFSWGSSSGLRRYHEPSSCSCLQAVDEVDEDLEGYDHYNDQTRPASNSWSANSRQHDKQWHLQQYFAHLPGWLHIPGLILLCLTLAALLANQLLSLRSQMLTSPGASYAAIANYQQTSNGVGEPLQSLVLLIAKLLRS